MAGHVTCPPGLLFLTKHRILLYLHCKAAIRPGKAIKVHWRNVHQWTGHQLQDVLAYVATLTIQDPSTVCMPAQSAPIPELPIFAGYSYNGCDYLTRSRKRRERHDREESHPESEAGWTQVQLQTYSHGRFAKYWTVHDEEEEEEEGDFTTTTPPSISFTWADMVTRQKQRDDKRRRKHLEEVDNPENLTKIST
ncbi:hypothetical protein AYO21_11641 [Fonsecaea monophora]|uniref:Uncharacterized protein n=1 Tax=Fonsecaea monophora TaxID=254056 RepID=A0A177ET27_9EURO|nr:hypothetical protein AYO21_11641 [Fonsecaea monophora]OAG34222.1 hypothetical protein AYO21_11641 [Fonsecaea monophora]